MYTHSKCKFCRTLLAKPATPPNAFCDAMCKRMFSRYGNIGTFRGDADAIQKASDSMGVVPTFGETTKRQRDRKDTATLKGTKQQPSLFQWEEATRKDKLNKPSVSRETKQGKKKKASPLLIGEADVDVKQ